MLVQWGSASGSRGLLVGLLLLAAACSRDRTEIVGNLTQATEVDESTNCFTDAECGLYACDANHDCNTSCARDSDCDQGVAYCDQNTGNCAPIASDAGSGEGGTGCGLYAQTTEGCFTDCRNDTMCASGAYCYQSTACHVDHCVGVNVDDDKVCTGDSCNQETGVVSHTNYPANYGCFDDDACNGDEMCDGAGACRAGTPILLSDGDACTSDSCDPANGSVSHAPLTEGDIDDLNPCTVDSCNPATGQSHSPGVDHARITAHAAAATLAT